MTLTLPDFLLARIAEDEARARPAWEARSARRVLGLPLEPAWPTPDRVLAECEAKRRIVGIWVESGFVERGVMDEVIDALALPYAVHPDFREEWRP